MKAALRQPSTDELRAYYETEATAKRVIKHSVSSRVVVAIGDLHGNPHPALLKLVAEQKPDLIIIGGDVYDQAQFSAHPKGWLEEKEQFHLEQKRILAYFQTLLSLTDAQIVVMRGNHDDRLFRRLVDLLPTDYLQYYNDPIQILADTIDDPRLTVNATAVSMKSPRMPEVEAGKIAYLYVEGDAFFSHLNFSGGQPGAAVKKFSDWMTDWHKVLGLPEPVLCVQFHTHQWSYAFPRAGYLCLVEPGFAGLPNIEGYKIGYHAKWKPGTLGAVAFKQSKPNGVWLTDTQSVRPLIP